MDKCSPVVTGFFVKLLTILLTYGINLSIFAPLRMVCTRLRLRPLNIQKNSWSWFIHKIRTMYSTSAAWNLRLEYTYTFIHIYTSTVVPLYNAALNSAVCFIRRMGHGLRFFKNRKTIQLSPKFCVSSRMFR
jgi:hypothetical protein